MVSRGAPESVKVRALQRQKADFGEREILIVTFDLRNPQALREHTGRGGDIGHERGALVETS